MSYSDQRAWSDLYMPAVKRIVGENLLTESCFEVDTQEATDLVMLSTRDIHVACRVRKHGFADRYPGEFTIRSKTKFGNKTEFAKIVDGMADWMFYGHANKDDNEIGSWMIINLDSFRAAMIRKTIKWIPKTNPDGTGFCAFNINQFPETPPILIASKGLNVAEAA